MALRLDILANTRQFVGDMKKAGASVEDVSDELDAMAREGDRAAEKLEDSFRELARTSQREGRKVGDGLDDGWKKAKRGADDFKDEANSILRETAASITSVEDALGAVQEIAANAFVGFGPVGAGAGLVAALGFGLLLENLNKQAEAADEFKRRWASAYQEAAEEGRTFLSEQQILQEANDIAFNPDRVEEYKQALKDAAAIGVDINDILLARAGDEESLQLVIDETKRKYDEVFADFARARSAEATEIVQIEDRYRNLGNTQTENADKAREAQDRRDGYHQREREQIDETRNKLLGLEQLGPFYPTVIPTVDDTQIRELEQRMARGLQVSVTALNGGRTWE
jgi:hypothetical protein